MAINGETAIRDLWNSLEVRPVPSGLLGGLKLQSALGEQRPQRSRLDRFVKNENALLAGVFPQRAAAIRCNEGAGQIPIERRPQFSNQI